MKTFYRKTLLFLSLLIGAGMSAQAQQELPETSTSDNPKYYLIKNYRSGKYAAHAGDAATLVQVSGLSNACKWYFTGTAETDGDGKSYLAVTIGNAASTNLLATTSSFTETGATWYIKANPKNTYGLCISLNSGLTGNCWDDQANHTSIGYYAPMDGDDLGTTWIISPYETAVVEEAASVLKFENLVGGYTTEQLADVKSLYNEGNVTDVDALFAALSTLATQDAIAITSGKAYSIVSTGRLATGRVMMASADNLAFFVESTTDDSDKWLIHTDADGKDYLFNIQTKLFLQAKTTLYQQWTLGEAPDALSFEVVSTGVYNIAEYEKSGSYNYAHEDGSANHPVVPWNASADPSKFTIKEVAVDADVLAAAQTTFDALFNLGSYKLEAASLLAMEGYVGGYTADQLSNLKSVYAEGNVTDATALKNAIDEVKAITSENMVQFDATKAYTLNNIRYSGSALTAADGFASNKTLDESSNNFKWIIYTANDGKQYLYNIGTGSFLIYSNVGEQQWTVAADDASPFSVELVDGTKSTVAYCVGSYGNTSNKGSYLYFMHAKSADGNIVRWEANADASQWMLKVVDTDETVLADAFAKAAEYVNNTVTIDALGYVTYCFPGAVDFTNSDVTAYVVSDADATTATLTEVTGVLPAETGVILYCATPGSYTIPSATGTATVGTNLLVGTLKETTLAAGEAYVLAANEAQDGVEFALLSDAEAADGGNVVSANRAYLPVSEVSGTSTRTLSFTFGTPTAIESATVESDEDVTWYTLGGVAVKNPSKGIYVNSKGKVVLFK